MESFDLFQSARLRDIGLAKVTSYPNDSWVSHAREVAINLAERFGRVTINDVLRFYPKPDSVHPNAIGGVLRDKRLKLVGFEKSDKISAHARRIGVYSVR